jgi:GNAT superfamily N-acetyltransferase
VIKRGYVNHEVKINASYTASLPQTSRKRRRITVNLATASGQDVGAFEAISFSKDCWTITHRFVEEHFRGFNLGKLGFRLIEQAAKNIGCKKLKVHTIQTEVLGTALSVGFKISKKDGPYIKAVFGLPKTKPLPNSNELLKIIHKEDSPKTFKAIELERIVE